MVREPAVAGAFYPGNKDTLSRNVEQMLAAAPTSELAGTIMGIAVPHAGYPYSGPTAALAYKAIAGSGAKTVIILGPSHHAAFEGLAVFAKGSWKTPLGLVPIDESLASEILKQNQVYRNLPQVHVQEHSIEVQVPFLQKTLKEFKIVPVEFGEAGYANLETAGKALARVCRNRSVLIVASSDLFHGYSIAECNRSDSVTLSLLQEFDARAFDRAIADGSASACGSGPLTALLVAMKELGADQVHVLHHTNSHEMTGEPDGQWVVGYAASMFTKGSEDSEARGSSEPPSEDSLGKEEQAELLRIARTTVESYVRSGETPVFKPLTEQLKQERGVFVTLKEHGDLRGCIGYIEGIKPIYEAVRDNAIAAATQDPRFEPVKTGELKDIDIEVTVLTPLERCTNPAKDVVAGKHGIVVRRGSRGGVFLPQVATETGWDTQTFLSQCCLQKAGLPADAWKDKGTEVYRFCGQVFGEKE